MTLSSMFVRISAICAIAFISGCGNIGSGSLSSGDGSAGSGLRERTPEEARQSLIDAGQLDPERETIWDLFSGQRDPNVTVEVNKYLWNASLDVLNFLPVQTVDPFTGVISTGYGTPPGGGRAYRATILIQDPALDARALNVSIERRGGGSVSPETVRAVEDAILTRARQLRIQDSQL
ncbi:DUF3576 domain-containing protein [Cochlodiniinecator piscidefendens]|uniref:DUF3576 domain-containing protein n=1 Tax=Cochlodiniinecator piscidefendens TaxID=2715756 RepID=UPI00140E2F78|nr:DUF3576 domain-containing protein [Cochlodiniinecator piscidefendens]